jgi:hypothetical protein
VKLTIYLQLVPRSGNRESIHPFLHTPSWCSVYLYTGTTLPLPYTSYILRPEVKFSTFPGLPLGGFACHSLECVVMVPWFLTALFDVQKLHVGEI